MRIAKDKEKDKSIEEKQYEILKSIHDQVEQELYCLKKQQEMLLKLIEQEEKKLNLKNSTSEFPIKNEDPKRHYNLRKKQQFQQDQVKLEKNQNNELKSLIPLMTKEEIEIAESYIYTGHKSHEQIRKHSRREDIFRIDEQLYEEDDQYGVNQ